MRGWLLTIGSVVLTGLVIGNAYYQKQQFFPSVVYITKSNPSLAVLYLQAFVFVILLGQLTRKVFFGRLRPAETEHLIERSWYAVTETCLAFTVFRDNFSPLFVAQFTMLLFLKCFHWLSEDRIDYMERSPVITIFFHLRAIGIFLLLGTLDSIFVHQAYHSVTSSGASTQLVFGFEYSILMVMVVAVFTKYVLHTLDLQSENPWESKAVFILYNDLFMGFFKSLLYIMFMVIMIRVHTFPLFAIRPMYLTLRSFKKSVNDIIMSRRAILNMNTLYPEATAEELEGDNVCIICREEMAVNCKKLPCNHIFHATCLRSWFQRQQTCPTCRMDVLQVQPRPAQQPPRGVPPAGIPPHVPPPFPMFPMGFPPVPPTVPPGTQPAGMSPLTTENGATAPTSPGTSAATVPPFIPPFPMMFPPPMFGFPFPPANHSTPNLSSLSTEELQAMEGQEREHVEARIAMLRNIHSLLDSAILQLNQYSQIITARSPAFPTTVIPTPSTSGNTATRTTAENIAKDKTVSSSVDIAGPSWAIPADDGTLIDTSETAVTPEDDSEAVEVISSAENDNDNNDSHNVRQRRIQRFSSDPSD